MQQTGHDLRAPLVGTVVGRSSAYPLGVHHHLAQVNVARLRAPLDDPAMREFTAAVAPIHRLARTSPGFVWQLHTDTGHGVSVQPMDGGPVFLNLTVWRDYESLHAFTYRGPHAGYLKRKSRWFVATPQPSTALWWLPAGRTPAVEEALARLRHLRRYGPTPQAFSLRRRFGADGRPARTGVRERAGFAGAESPLEPRSPDVVSERRG